jgi:hypothetical protein
MCGIARVGLRVQRKFCCFNVVQRFKAAILAKGEPSLELPDSFDVSTAADSSSGQPAGSDPGDVSLTSVSSTRFRRLSQVVRELSGGCPEWHRIVRELLTTNVHDAKFTDEAMMNNVAAEGRPLAILNVVSIQYLCHQKIFELLAL